MMPLVTNIEYLLQHERLFDLYFGTYVCVGCLIFWRVCGGGGILKLICCLGIVKHEKFGTINKKVFILQI